MKLIHLYRVTLTGLLVCALSAQGQQGSNNVEQRVDSILSQMTLADKLSYIGGTGFFDVRPIPGVNLSLNPQLFQTDAGLGVRVTPASVRYPAGPVLAATWNPDRARDLGAGDEFSQRPDRPGAHPLVLLRPGTDERKPTRLDHFRVSRNGRREQLDAALLQQGPQLG